MALTQLNDNRSASNLKMRPGVQQIAAATRKRSLGIWSSASTVALLRNIMLDAPTDGRIRWQAVMIGVIVLSVMCLGTVYITLDFIR